MRFEATFSIHQSSLMIRSRSCGDTKTARALFSDRAAYLSSARRQLSLHEARSASLGDHLHQLAKVAFGVNRIGESGTAMAKCKRGGFETVFFSHPRRGRMA